MNRTAGSVLLILGTFAAFPAAGAGADLHGVAHRFLEAGKQERLTSQVRSW